MLHIDYFKLQSKNLVRDYKTQFKGKSGDVFSYRPRFFDVDQIVKDFKIDETKDLSLMKAQHIVAQLAGFKKWTDLIKATEFQLELGKLFFNNRISKTKEKIEGTFKKSMVKAKLKDGQMLYFEFGEWKGFEHDIVELNCNYISNIKDFSPLSKLINLKDLQMIAVGIKDLSSISTLYKLENLQLEINEIKDLTPLENLTNLTHLNVAENLVEDISPLAKCKNLETLYIDDNLVKSLSPLAKLKKLSVLDFVFQRPFINDLTPLAEIKNLRIVVCNGEFDGNVASFEQINERIKAGKAVAGIKK